MIFSFTRKCYVHYFWLMMMMMMMIMTMMMTHDYGYDCDDYDDKSPHSPASSVYVSPSVDQGADHVGVAPY